MYRQLLLYSLLLQILSQRYLEIADSFKNYSSTQNLNGWNYGYYKNNDPRAIFNDFLPASSGTSASSNSWKIPSNYCQINKDTTHPSTGPGSNCGTTGFGLCKPSLKFDPNSSDSIYNALKNNGELWLYYDVRPVDSCDHLALNHPGIIQRISEKFNITKISESINPKHNGWSGITSSIRLVAIKKSNKL
jgi:hypothetical protein